MNTIQREKFLQDVKVADLTLNDDGIFAQIIRQAAEEFTDEELSTMFTVSLLTINRWKKGQTTPDRRIKPLVYQILADHLRRRLYA